MEFSASDMIRFGWETFKKRPWFFIQVMVVQVLLTWAINVLSAQFSDGSALSFIGTALRIALSMLLSMGVTALLLKAHDAVESAALEDLWHPRPFWQYLGAGLLYGLGIFVGIILLIIPGIIVLLTYQFASYVVVDRNFGPIKALKESARITRGHRLELLLLFLLVLILNIAGLLALVVGLFVTIPVTMLAVVHAYRTLEHKASEITPAPVV
ncbi:MAG: hypothetical protein AAB899_01890 [Patescibacteria group bacterium]